MPIAKGQQMSEERVQEMFSAYCSVPNFHYVAKTCNVHTATVKRYWLDGDWENRRNAIIQKSREELDLDIVSCTKRSINLIQTAKGKIEEKLATLSMKDMNPAFLVSDLERVVKLEQLLLGGVGERREIIHITHEERVKALRRSREVDVTPRRKALGG